MTTCYEISVSISPEDGERGRSEVQTALARVPADGFAEFWIDQGGSPTICALMNGDRGWLIYLREEGDPGYRSENPDYAGLPGTTIEYVLSNGQGDRYPAAWSYPRDEVFAGLRSFAVHASPPTTICWVNQRAVGR
jgi:hypothetical protein